MSEGRLRMRECGGRQDCAIRWLWVGLQCAGVDPRGGYFKTAWKKERAMPVERLEIEGMEGVDEACRPYYLKASCDACAVAFINGVLCHERGCPEVWRDEVRTCKWCGSDFIPATATDRFCDQSCYDAYRF